MTNPPIIKAAEQSADLAPIKFTSLREKCSCKNKCKPDVSFGIADIKYSDGSLKILEFGEGTLSKFKGFDSIYGTGAMLSRIYKFCAEECKQLFVVDHDLEFPNKRTAAGYPMLLKKHAVVYYSRDDMLSVPKNNTKAEGAGEGAQLLVLQSRRASHKRIQNINAVYPSMRVANAAISPFVNNKKQTDKLFTKELRDYRPYTAVVEKRDAQNQVAAILEACPAKYFVLKPIASSRGIGILFAHRDQLELMFKKLFSNYGLKSIVGKIKKIIDPHGTSILSKSNNVKFWQYNTDTHFIIESCESSKAVTVDNKSYDATLRLSYGLIHKDGYVEAKAIGYYWKLPRLSLDTKGSFTNKKLSRIGASNKNSAAALAPEDETAVTALMLPILNNVYTKMILHAEKQSSAE
jgi:hypothetical protein